MSCCWMCCASTGGWIRRQRRSDLACDFCNLGSRSNPKRHGPSQTVADTSDANPLNCSGMQRATSWPSSRSSPPSQIHVATRPQGHQHHLRPCLKVPQFSLIRPNHPLILIHRESTRIPPTRLGVRAFGHMVFGGGVGSSCTKSGTWCRAVRTMTTMGSMPITTRAVPPGRDHTTTPALFEHEHVCELCDWTFSLEVPPLTLEASKA